MAVLLCILCFTMTALAGNPDMWGVKSGLGGVAVEQGILRTLSHGVNLRLKGGMDDAAKAARAARAARAKEQAEAAKAAGEYNPQVFVRKGWQAEAIGGRGFSLCEGRACRGGSGGDSCSEGEITDASNNECRHVR